MSLSIPSNEKFNFGSGIIYHDGVEKYGIYWPLLNFQNIYREFRPKTLEDFKAMVWMFGGSKPSDTENVEMKATDDGKTIVFIITPRVKADGIQQEQESNREGEVSSPDNAGEQREVSSTL